MLRRLIFQAMPWSMGLLRMFLPSNVVAQEPTYFQVLSVPPRSVGTCMSARGQDSSADGVAREAHLVVTSIAPNRRREIGVVNDVKRDGIRFMDVVLRSNGLLSSSGDYVVAIIDASGRVRGFRQHRVVQMSDSSVAGLDTAGLRAMGEHTGRKSSAEPLNTTAQRKVRQLADWVRKRCPT